MDRLKRWCQRLFFLPVIVTVPLAAAAAALLVYAFADPNAPEWICYGSYFISAYALAVVCVRIPGMVQFAGRIKRENRYISRYFGDEQLRMKTSLYSSVTMNILYALLQLVYGFVQHSIWFYALAAYYALLAVMRFFLLKETRRQSKEKNLFMEFLLYRLCGVLLVLMNLALAVIVTYIVWQNRGFSYHYIVTIAMAAFTFYSVTMAIIQLIKGKKNRSPIPSAARVITLAAALVSMLSLETAMLNAFGQQEETAFRQIMTALSGTGVCIAILMTAIFMIIHSTRAINRIKGEMTSGES